MYSYKVLYLTELSIMSQGLKAHNIWQGEGFYTMVNHLGHQPFFVGPFQREDVAAIQGNVEILRRLYTSKA